LRPHTELIRGSFLHSGMSSIMNDKTPPTIISLGGSLIVPKEEPDTNFLKMFQVLLRRRVVKGHRFVVVCGGGALARHYQGAARKLGCSAREALDWIGIHSTRLNARVVRAAFGDDTHKAIVTNPNRPPQFRESILVAAGWRPGRSTDHVAVLLAKRFGSNTVINVSDIDQVYNIDPKKDPRAFAFTKMSWEDFRSLVDAEWHPGSHLPFDPIAARYAQKFAMKVKIVNGHSQKDLSTALSGRKFFGTVIG